MSQCKQFTKIRYHHLDFSLRKSDNCCILKNGTVCIIDNIIFIDNSYFLLVRKFNLIEDFYDVGITSSSINVYKCSQLSEIRCLIAIDYVTSKCYKMPLWEKNR